MPQFRFVIGGWKEEWKEEQIGKNRITCVHCWEAGWMDLKGLVERGELGKFHNMV